MGLKKVQGFFGSMFGGKFKGVGFGFWARFEKSSRVLVQWKKFNGLKKLHGFFVLGFWKKFRGFAPRIFEKVQGVLVQGVWENQRFFVQGFWKSSRVFGSRVLKKSRVFGSRVLIKVQKCLVNIVQGFWKEFKGLEKTLFHRWPLKPCIFAPAALKIFFQPAALKLRYSNIYKLQSCTSTECLSNTQSRMVSISFNHGCGHECDNRGGITILPKKYAQGVL